jgi:hypothetical protein
VPADSPKNQNEKADHPRFFSLGFWLIVLFGFGLLGFVTLISFRPQSIDNRLVFFMGSLLNACIVIAIVFQAFIYRKQWDAMQGQLAVMREAQKSFAIGERAYLIIEDVAFIEKGIHPRLLYTLYNGGRTPAFNVRSETEASLGTEPPTDKLRSLGHPHGDTVDMPAGTRKQVQGTNPKFSVTNAQWGAVNAGSLTFFVRGIFRYKDFQDIERVLPFCVGYDVSLNRFAHYKAADYSEKTN